MLLLLMVLLLLLFFSALIFPLSAFVVLIIYLDLFTQIQILPGGYQIVWILAQPKCAAKLILDSESISGWMQY